MKQWITCGYKCSGRKSPSARKNSSVNGNTKRNGSKINKKPDGIKSSQKYLCHEHVQSTSIADIKKMKIMILRFFEKFGFWRYFCVKIRQAAAAKAKRARAKYNPKFRKSKKIEFRNSDKKETFFRPFWTFEKIKILIEKLNNKKGTH